MVSKDDQAILACKVGWIKSTCRIKLLIKYIAQNCPARKSWLKSYSATCVWLLSVQNISLKIHPKSSKPKIPKLKKKERKSEESFICWVVEVSIEAVAVSFYFVLLPVCRFPLISLQRQISRKHSHKTLLWKFQSCVFFCFKTSVGESFSMMYQQCLLAHLANHADLQNNVFDIVWNATNSALWECV